MSPVEKAFALLHAVTREEIEGLPPFIRRRFAQQCRHLADIADSADEMLPAPRSGVLGDLHMGERTQ